MADKQGVFRLKTLNNLLAMVIVMSVMGPGLTYGKQTSMRKEIERLSSLDPVERAAAVKGLGRIADPRAVEPLILALGDEDPQVRKNAVTALRWIQDPRAVEPLIGSLKDEVREVRQGAVQALGRFRDPRAVDPLIGVLRDWPSMYSVGRSLKEIGEPAVEPLIAALADDDSAVRAAAAEALGSIEDPRAVEPPILALGDEDPQARKNAATALRWFRDPRAVGPLIGALKDKDKAVQREAAWALSKTAGIDFGKNSLEWLEWWEKNKETFLKKK